MIIIIVPGARILRHESTTPACTLNISAIGVFDAERNPTYSPAIKKLLQDELELPAERSVHQNFVLRVVNKTPRSLFIFWCGGRWVP